MLMIINPYHAVEIRIAAGIEKTDGMGEAWTDTGKIFCLRT